MRVSSINALFALNKKGRSFKVPSYGFTGKFEEKVRIIPSAAKTSLAQNLEKNTGISPTPTLIKKFKNGEIYVNIQGDVRGKDVYLMPATNENINDNLIETYLKADAAKRSGANKVIAILPSFDYARQEKRTEQGEPLAAKVNMDLLKASGVDEIITEDLHSPAIEGFVSNSMKITHLESMPLVKKYIQDKQIPDLVVVSPDLGGTKRIDKLAKALNCEKAIVYKHRQAHNEATAEDLIGNVNGKNCVIYDDILDTGGTIVEVAKLLKKNNAKDIYVCATHAYLSGNAVEKLQQAPVKEIITTNSVQRENQITDKFEKLDISLQIAEAMRKISET
jgi:ribose-phosphate pyrophosphokinase